MSSQQKPNILFLMTDQQRWDALGCVNSIVKTPNLDKLAAQGIRFEQAVCPAPACVPSRYSMMLGLYASQCGVRSNNQCIPSDDELPAPVLAQYLSKAGYQTAGIGKTHWYVETGVPLRPSKRGFEFRANSSINPATYEPDSINMAFDAKEDYDAILSEGKQFNPSEGKKAYIGMTSRYEPERHREYWLKNQAIKFLESRDGNRPFFLYFSTLPPHAPHRPPAKYENLYDITAVPS